MANPSYQDPAAPDHYLETLQVGTESGKPLRAEAVNPSASQATVTSVAYIAGDVQLLAATATRLGAVIVNEADRDLYVKLGTGATSTSYTRKVPPDGEYQAPARYVGAIHGIWVAGGAGAARITELIPA
jgi:hypothetical protein